MDKIVISLQNFLPPIIVSREAVEYFKKEIQIVEGASYVFDFTKISFISRAFADELYKYLKTANIQFEIRNANSNVSEIFKAVKRNRTKELRVFHEIAVTKFRNQGDFLRFLSLI